MKKKISLLLCVLIMTLSFAGCSGKDDSGVEYDEATLQSTAEVIILSFSQWDGDTFDQFKSLSDFQLEYTLMQTGLRVSGEDFIILIETWESAEEECGEYLSHGEYTVEEKSSGITLSTDAVFENRTATITFNFDESSTLETMGVSADYQMGEILSKAGLNTLLGMGTVFLVLIFLAFLIYLMKFIPGFIDKLTKKEKKNAQVQETAKPVVVATAPAENVDVTDDLELVAVITAAIAAQEGTSTDGFVVRSIRRRPSNHWA